MQHLITLEHLNTQGLNQILNLALQFLTPEGKIVEAAPAYLAGKTVVNLFFEPSTRTRCSFELAAKKLGATVLNLDIQSSSSKKGESLQDTALTLQAMQCDIFIVRHSENGAPQLFADVLKDNGHVINAGDGTHAHPTQALLDMLTIKNHKKNFKQLSIAIVGDVLHSRVAQSDIQALHILGVPDIRVIGPQSLLPDNAETLGVKVFHDLQTGLKDVDIIMVLRPQLERMAAHDFSKDEYCKKYCVTLDSLRFAKSDAIVMHPGPINRDVEIASAVAYGPQSVILQQVTNGVAVRMAVMALLVNPHL
ncbi:MAG: aspartate carbamoyltransferase catalytic subunit [Gammaproteobacteria bacterium]|jgi:aspartate carbamoyltransferase catalytic subunit